MTTKPVDPKKKAASLRGNANALKSVRQRQIERGLFDFNASPAANLDQKKWQGATEALKDLEQAWIWQT